MINQSKKINKIISQRERFKDLENVVQSICNGDQLIISKAITLTESALAADQKIAAELLQLISKVKTNSVRIAITGPPGVGKSSFIDELGKLIINEGKKVAVLPIDPSDQEVGGSILGDKTRMSFLAKHPNAFVRPSPAGKQLGGIAAHSRESMRILEAAAYDVIIIETVGIGQSEIYAKQLSDLFILLAQPGAGDDLQGIKKGVMETADMVFVNKSDGEQLDLARRTRTALLAASKYLNNNLSESEKRPIYLSSINKLELMNENWIHMKKWLLNSQSKALFSKRRKSQELFWFNFHTEQLLLSALSKQPSLIKQQADFRKEIVEGNADAYSSSWSFVQAVMSKLLKD